MSIILARVGKCLMPFSTNVRTLHYTLFPIILTLCLMLSVTHYAQYYAGIIGWSLGQSKGTYDMDS